MGVCKHSLSGYAEEKGFRGQASRENGSFLECMEGFVRGNA